MTEEENKAIENFEKRLIIEKYTKNIRTPVYIKDIETLLNLIQRQDRQINLMARCMHETGVGRRAFTCDFGKECNEYGCRVCIKQYFAEQAKEVEE